jgi:tetratricopeptide (TPR) repeat protein
VPEQLPDLSAFTEWDEQLREVAADHEAIETAITAAESQLAQGDPRAESRLLGYLGNATRTLGRTDESLDYLRRSLDAALDETARIKAMIRIGETHRCRDEHETGIAVLTEAAALARVEAPELEDFALQHLGKCLVDAGRTPEGVEQLERALALRLGKGDPSLIASTAEALARAGQREPAT